MYGDVCGMCGGDMWVGMCTYVCEGGGGDHTQEHNIMTDLHTE